MLGASVNFLAVVVCGGMTSQNIIYEDAVEVDKKSLSDALTSSACLSHEEGISHIKTGESNRTLITKITAALERENTPN